MISKEDRFNEIKEILSISKEIVTRLGEQSIEYKPENKTYGYDKINTYNYNKGNIDIIYEEGDKIPLYLKVTVAKNEVLYYHFGKSRVRYYDGRWVDKIKDIHDGKDLALKEKKEVFPNIGSLLENTEYFKYYFDCMNNKPEIFDYIQRRLAQICIFFAKRNRKLRSYESFPEWMCEWNVIYNNEIVLLISIYNGEKFNGKSFLPVSYAEGEWLGKFLLVIKEAMELEELYISQQMDDGTDKKIKK